MKNYKVHVNTRRRKYVYFDTLAAAKAFCEEVFAKTNIVLSIVKTVPDGDGFIDRIIVGGSE